MLWFAQNSLPLRWQRQLRFLCMMLRVCCDLLKIHYLCGDKDNLMMMSMRRRLLWFAQNSLPLRWQRQRPRRFKLWRRVVICSKFITFAVTKTTENGMVWNSSELWFAQNSLPLRWQRQLYDDNGNNRQALWFAQNSLPLRWQRQHHAQLNNCHGCCDLLKIHYLCGDKDNNRL